MIRRTCVAVLTAALLTALTAGSALAGTTSVTQAIKAQDKIVRANPEYKQLARFNITTAAQAKAAIPKFEALKRLLDQAAAVVSHASASSAAQKEGQTDWVIGARDVARYVGDVGVALSDILKGDKPAAKATLLKAETLAKASAARGAAADKLLGLPKGA